MIRTESLVQTMVPRVQETPARACETDSLFLPARSSLTGQQPPETSLRQRTTSKPKTADNPIVAAFAFFTALRRQAQATGVELAVFCRLNRHGILGRLFSEDARTASALCEMRLADLKDDLKTFSDIANRINGRKDKAIAMLAEMEEALKDIEEQPAVFLDLLADYEKEFGKVSFLTILDARFMKVEGAGKFDLRTVNKEGTFISVEQQMQEITAQLGRENAFDDARAIEAAIAEAELIQVTPGSELTEEALLEVYIQNNPALVARMVTSRVDNELLAVETSVNRGLARAAIDMEPTAEVIHNLLRTSEDLKNDIMVEIATLHTGRLFNELSAFDVEAASVEELLAARQQCLVFNQLQKNFEGELSTAEIQEQKAELEAMQVAIATRMIRLYTASEAEKPAGQRLFWLKAPATGQVMARLAGTELMESTETTLYKNILAYMDAREAFARTGDDRCLTRMQQARFDMLRGQQYQLTQEMEAGIAGTDAASVLGNGEFHADMELLETIYQVRQTTAKYRPVDTLGENVLRMAGNVIWRDELPLNDIKARLVHNFHLKQLGYSFKEEFMALCGDSPETFSQVCAGIKKVASQTAEGAKALTTTKTGLFQAIGLGTKAYNNIQKVLGDTLKEVLTVAERNPVAFRRMCGDFAQLVPQLKLLVGSNTELTGVIDQISFRLAAESAASCFAGDQAVKLDEEVAPDSDLARNLKRFQFFCDLSAGMLKGTTGLNVITSALSGPVGMAKALFNVGSMVVTREMVNRMPADEVRMLDKLFRYGPVAGWTATSPFDITARAARNLGQNKGIVTSVTSAVFAPYIKRYNALTEAIMNVYNHRPGAWAELALESAKTTAVLAATAGATCLAASTLAASGTLAMAGCVLTAGQMVASFSYGTAQLISYLEENNLLGRVVQSIEMFSAQYFSGNSKLAKAIRLRCQTEAASMVAGMKRLDAYQQQITDKAARAMFKAHWGLVSMQQAHVIRADSFLTKNREKRQQQARELAGQIRVLRLIDENLQKASEISRSNEKLAELQQQMTDLGRSDRLPAAGLAHYLLNLKQELSTAIERQCGTDKPGVSPEQIEETLAEHQKQVMLGSVVRETLMLTDAARVKEITAKAEQDHCREVSRRMAGIEQQRVQLMYCEALRELAECQKAMGMELTVAELEKMDLEAALQPGVEKQMQQLRDINALRVDQFKARARKLQIVKDMTEASQERVLAAAVA